MSTPRPRAETETETETMATLVKEDRIDAAPGAPRLADSTPPVNSRKRVMLGLLALAALLGGGWAVKQFTYARAHESTDNAQVNGHIVPVIAKVGGYVTTVSVAENDSVHAGQVLVKIDDAEYRVRNAQAAAELAAAEAAVGGRGTAEASVQSASSQRNATSSQIQAARANLEKARSDYARFKELADKQIVSQLQLDAARAQVEAQEASLEALQSQQAAAGATVTGAEANQRLAEARLAAARALRDNAALQLSYTTVSTPASGQVSRKMVEVGQLVQPGQTLLSIVADTGTWIDANFKETQLASVRVGQPVQLEVDAYPGCEAAGKVLSLSAATGAKFALLPPDNATGNFTKVVQRVPVRIQVTQGCGADRPLRPGMSVVAHVATK
jgi:membrane fusion protein (multidrug efflux system)